MSGRSGTGGRCTSETLFLEPESGFLSTFKTLAEVLFLNKIIFFLETV